MGQPRPLLSFIFGLFKQHHFKFYSKQVFVKKCPSSIRCQDLNPRPLELESPPITTRPGLLPLNHLNLFAKAFLSTVHYLLWNICKLTIIIFYFNNILKQMNNNNCDQLIRLFFNIWLFTTMKICPIAQQICQIKLKIFPNTKRTLSKWPKCFNIMPQWRNFAQIWSH